MPTLDAQGGIPDLNVGRAQTPPLGEQIAKTIVQSFDTLSSSDLQDLTVGTAASPFITIQRVVAAATVGQWQWAIDGSNNLTLDRIVGTGNFIWNQNSESVDFRMEGATDTELFFLDGSTDRIGISTTTPATTFDIQGALTVNGILSQDDTTDTSSATTGSMHTDGGVGIAKALWVGTTSRLVGVVTCDVGISVDGTTDSTSGTTGSIHTDGGLGVLLDLFVGAQLLVNGTGPHAIGGAANNFSALTLLGSFTSGSASTAAMAFDNQVVLTGAATDTAFLTGTRLTTDIITQTATETIAVISQLRIDEPNITDNLTGDITVAATVHITGAPTEGEANYALWVDDGAVQIDSTLTVSGGITTVGDLSLDGDLDFVGPQSITTSTGDLSLTPAANLIMSPLLNFINDNVNANMTIGLTINQGANDNQILAFKSSDVAHGLTTALDALANDIDAETDDFLSVVKMRDGKSGGGAILRAISEDAVIAVPIFEIQAHGFQVATTDTTTSLGMVNIFASEHTGLNALRIAATDDNLFTIQAWNAGARVTHLLLKADDGELHLGNTTLVALDAEDDTQLVRAMQWETSKGKGMQPTPWDTTDYGVPPFSYEKLKEIGVLGEKDKNVRCLFRVQPRFAMNEGAIWQAYIERQELCERIEKLEQLLLPVGL